MKKIMYGTILLFVAIMIIVIVVASFHPVETVKYENGAVVDEMD